MEVVYVVLGGLRDRQGNFSGSLSPPFSGGRSHMGGLKGKLGPAEAKADQGGRDCPRAVSAGGTGGLTEH